MPKKPINPDLVWKWFFLVIILIGMVAMIIYAFTPAKEKTVKFEVTGITNSTDASSLASLHFECIKYCVHESGSITEEENCFEQCVLLGKEGCS